MILETTLSPKMIACAPLHGAHFRADSRRVHQLLKTFLVAETAEQWIKNLEPHADGRRDMLALQSTIVGRAMQVGKLQPPNG